MKLSGPLSISFYFLVYYIGIHGVGMGMGWDWVPSYGTDQR